MTSGGIQQLFHNHKNFLVEKFSSLNYELKKLFIYLCRIIDRSKKLKAVILSEKQKVIIEKIGISHEMAGIQPAAARILGLMYVADNPELSFEEITDTLKISKSATSNALNSLLNTGQIEYTTYLGDRKRYFRLKISNWKDAFSKRVEGMTNFHTLLEEVLKIRTKETVKFNESLEELIHFLNFVNQELPLLFERWQKTRE